MKLRRTMLYIPGNHPGMIKDAGIYPADCLMFDLEDSVALSEKDAARTLVYEALMSLDYTGKELIVRINDPKTDTGKEDIRAMVRTGKVGIRLPKTETPEDVFCCEDLIAQTENEVKLPIGFTPMIAAIESALGVIKAYDIAVCSKRLIAIAIGAEDYVTDLHTTRSRDGKELFYGRSAVLLAARAAGIDAIDTVFSDVNDEEGFRSEVQLIKELGFDGKSIVNPRQIKTVHELFCPSTKEITGAERVISAIKEANERGSGVASLDGKMVDRPVVLRAIRTLTLASANDLWEGDLDGLSV